MEYLYFDKKDTSKEVIADFAKTGLENLEDTHSSIFSIMGKL